MLLEFLIDRQHEVFRGKGSPAELKRLMQKVVMEEYPESEPDVCLEQREGHIPASIANKLREMEEEKRKTESKGQSWCHKTKLFRDKNATPGDGATCASRCLEEIRPLAMCLDRNDTSTRNPEDAREGSLSQFGALHIQTSSRFRSQWCPQYFSEVLPFVIPRMVSGPDFREDEVPWRRQKFAEAPRVPVQLFVKGFARRVEASCRTDWTALSICRSVSWKFTAEHTMSILANFIGKKGWTADTKATEYVRAAQNLYHHLQKGFSGTGVHRVPIAGDTSRLPYATGLTALEKRLAWAQHFLAKNLPGSQQLRQVMGHRQFGARVVYGDCIMLTISPNEQHSCLVLRLSRFRTNDPYLKWKDDEWKKLAQMDYPSLEAKKRKCGHGTTNDAANGGPSPRHNVNDDEICINLPEYDLRKIAAARDPLAVVEAYRVEIMLRLASVLGVRMCPHCPRCNNKKGNLGCQDRFGSNMRPMGGVLGGMDSRSVQVWLLISSPNSFDRFCHSETVMESKR